MIIEIDHEFDEKGEICAVHTFDSSDSVSVAAITALNANPAARAPAGWDTLTKHKLSQKGETRWMFFVRQVKDVNGPANLKVLNLK